MEPVPKIKLPKPFTLSDKLKRKLDTLKNKSVASQVIRWNGYDNIQNLFYLYLFNKYKTKCLIYNKKPEHQWPLLGFEIVLDKYILDYEKQYYTKIAENIADCVRRGEKTIIIPLTIINPEKDRHANVLIYRENSYGNVIEHFEPHGKAYKRGRYKKEIDLKLSWFMMMLNEVFTNAKLPRVVFKDASDVCPYLNGLQAIENVIKPIILETGEVETNGYCLAWSMFFTELALKNPTIPSDILLDEIYNTILDTQRRVQEDKILYLKQVIRGYVLFISEKIDKYFSILFKDKINVQELTSRTNDVLFNRKVKKFVGTMIDIEMKILNDPTYNRGNVIDTLKKKVGDEMRRKYPRVDHLNRLQYDINILENIDMLIDASPISQTPICPEGKELNFKTGKCVNIKKIKTEKITTVKASTVKTKTEKRCPEGKELNPKTGRCVNIKKPKTEKIKTVKAKTDKIKTVKAKTEKQCPEGKELNPKTGRCVNIKKPKTEKTRTRKLKIKI